MATVDQAVLVWTNNPLLRRFPSLDHPLLALWNVALQANVNFMVVPFLYRFLRVCYPDKATYGVFWMLLIVPTLFSLAFFYTCWAYLDPSEGFQDIALGYVSATGWTLHDVAPNGRRILGSNLQDTKCATQFLLTILSDVLCYATIIWSERRVLKKFKANEGYMQSDTRRMHSELHRALVALGLCPLMFELLPMAACLIVVSAGIRLGVFGTFVASILSCSALVHPLTTCFFIKPYRMAVAECFGWAPTNLITVTSTGGGGGNQSR